MPIDFENLPFPPGYEDKSPLERLEEQRPIYAALPGIQGQYCDYEILDPNDDNDLNPAAYLVEFWETRYFDWNETIDQIETACNDPSAETLLSNQLDFLAPFFGWGYVDQPIITFPNAVKPPPDLWNTEWTENEKFGLLWGVYHEPFIWRYFGSEGVILYLFKVFNLPFGLREFNGFYVNFSGVGVDFIGGSQWQWEITIPINANQREKQLAEWISFNFFPEFSRCTLVTVANPLTATTP